MLYQQYNNKMGIMPYVSLMDLIAKMVNVSAEFYYKKHVLKYGNNDYFTTENYFKQFVKAGQFEGSTVYKKYNEWISSEQYKIDIKKLHDDYINNMFEGFNSRIEEHISMEDEDDEIEKMAEMRDTFNALKNEKDKLDYLSSMYDSDRFYPPMDNMDSFLYYLFEDRL